MAEMTTWPTEPSSGKDSPGRDVSQRDEARPGEVSGRQVADEAREVASHVADQAKDLVGTRVSRGAERSAGDIRDVAQALRRTRQELEGNIAAPYVERAARELERLSRFLRTASADEVARDAERFARREPLLFLGGAFALGILGARFLKSSARHAQPSGPPDPILRRVAAEGQSSPLSTDPNLRLGDGERQS